MHEGTAAYIEKLARTIIVKQDKPAGIMTRIVIQRIAAALVRNT